MANTVAIEISPVKNALFEYVFERIFSSSNTRDSVIFYKSAESDELFGGMWVLNAESFADMLVYFEDNFGVSDIQIYTVSLAEIPGTFEINIDIFSRTVRLRIKNDNGINSPTRQMIAIVENACSEVGYIFHIEDYYSRKRI